MSKIVLPSNLRLIHAQTEQPCELCGQPISAGGEAVQVKGSLAHPACKTRRWSLLTSAAIAEQLGLTSPQFLKLAKQLDLEPESSYPNPYYRSGPEVPLWPPELVDGLAEHPAVTSLKARSLATRQARQRKAAERQTSLTGQYPDWREALLPAAQAMFNLNRYVKWESCSPAHWYAIYWKKLKQLTYSHD